MNKLTLISCYIVSLCLSLCFTYLLMFSLAFFFIDSVALLVMLSVALLLVLSMTFLFILGFTLLFRNIFTLLFWYRLSPWNLNSVALLPGLIPAFVLPDCSTGRNTTVGTSKEKQESQHLHTWMMILMSTREYSPC